MNEQKPSGIYAPLSPWSYFGLTILFSVPVVGLVFLIIFSINGNNINRRNFARSYWIGLILVLALSIIAAIIAFATGAFTSIINNIQAGF